MIVADWLEVTVAVEIRNVPAVCPAGTTIVAGTVADGRELAREIRTPPAGAAAARVTVPVAVLPPETEFGAMEIDPMVASTVGGACTVRTAETLLAEEAEIVTGVVILTGEVAMGNEPLLLPAGTTTLTGTVAAGPPLDRFTNTPPRPAGAASVIVPEAEPPPATDCGDIDSVPSVPCPAPPDWMVNDAVMLLADAAVITAVIVAGTAAVATANVPAVAPAGITRTAGTVAAGWLLERDMATPPDGAGEASVTVPVALAPPATLDGVMVIPPTVALPVLPGVIVSRVVTLFKEAATIDICLVSVTPDVEIVNVPELCPAGIVRLAGTVAAGSAAVSRMITPPSAAGFCSSTVPVEATPPGTEAGATRKDPMLARLALEGVIVSTAETLTPPLDAVMVACTAAATDVVGMEKVACVEPALRNTAPPGIAAEWLLVMPTEMPPSGAAAAKVMVPRDASPPGTEDGCKVICATGTEPVPGARMVI